MIVRSWAPLLSRTCRYASFKSRQNHHLKPLVTLLKSCSPTPPKPFHTIVMDFKGPLKDSSYALVMLDLYSKWPEVYWTTSTSFEAIKKNLDNFISTHGRPSYIRSDNGLPFQTQTFADYLMHLKYYTKQHLMQRRFTSIDH